MAKDTHLELDDEHKTRLLTLGLSSEAAVDNDDPDEARRDALYDIIVSSLPIPRATASTVPGPLQGLSQELVAIAGKSLGEMLKDTHTSLSTFKQIKD
ncbi:hypothetical protein ACFL3F_02055 [Planctomycetota bacterium]